MSFGADSHEAIFVKPLRGSVHVLQEQSGGFAAHARARTGRKQRQCQHPQAA